MPLMRKRAPERKPKPMAKKFTNGVDTQQMERLTRASNQFLSRLGQGAIGYVGVNLLS